MSRLARALAATFWLTALASIAQSPATPYKYVRIGNPADAGVTPHPGYALMGGGTDLDEAFQWLCNRAPGGDFLILRAHGNDDYNPYVQKLCKLNSVATLILPSRESANDPFAAKTISHASILFIAGGDQANYINFWMGTPVQSALNDAINRGIPIGGTSAGLAVLGEYAYSAQGDKPEDKDLDSKTVLANPFHPRVTLVHGFLEIPILKNVITDSHFAKRNRMGRLLVFLARLNEPDGKEEPPSGEREIHGIGIEQQAAVLLEPNGKAQIVGSGSAYFVEPAKNAVIAEKNKPIDIPDTSVQKVSPGHTFNLNSWTGDPTRYTLSAKNGIIHSTQPGDAIY